MKDLVTSLGLPDRYISEVLPKEQWKWDIQWDDVNKRLSEKKNKSVEYLRSEIQKSHAYKGGTKIMTKEEKLAMLEEVMDLDEGTLTEDAVLEDIEEWDSLSVLTLISEMKKKFNISLSTQQIREFKTVADICAVIPE